MQYFKVISQYGHLWYFRVNGIFVHPIFRGFEYEYMYIVIFCNYACINIFIIGNRYFTKSVMEKQFYK